MWWEALEIDCNANLVMCTDPGMQKYFFSLIQPSDTQGMENTWLVQHHIYGNITGTDSSIPIYTAKRVSFDKCGISPSS